MNQSFTLTPHSPKDLFLLANKVKRGIPVYLDLRHLDSSSKDRILDFFSGMHYGLGGYMKEIQRDLFYINKKIFSLDLFLRSFQFLFR